MLMRLYILILQIIKTFDSLNAKSGYSLMQLSNQTNFYFKSVIELVLLLRKNYELCVCKGLYSSILLLLPIPILLSQLFFVCLQHFSSLCYCSVFFLNKHCWMLLIELKPIDTPPHLAESVHHCHIIGKNFTKVE